MKEKLELYKRKHQEQAHRLLKIIRKLECYQTRGSSWYPEEEAFHARLEHIQRELNKPTQFRGFILDFFLIFRFIYFNSFNFR